ncbi:hypothetical protein GCM10010460_30890 [Microbacterium terrae]|uniref:Phosphotransferase enzyme family protein n=1 Tax=Microbacterium terrae TaxID=69369 RepID=A0A0M2GWA2_9MICO|nr:Phosphotransferase enzyme family protein [Microbacterium terrae]GLJ99038.1 hypothetical protein GCM10017594_22350 [Microbacterium terrae]
MTSTPESDADGGPDVEVALTGGNMEPVVRVGDTVRRQTGPWTPAVHALLGCWAGAGIDETARALGTDEKGREVLSFLPGEVLAGAAPEALWSDRILTDAARLLRRLHDASAGLAMRGDLEWRSVAREPHEVICHNDYAPYNLLVSGGRLSGVIDVDFAGPGPRIRDVGYLAYRLAPFAEDSPEADGLDRRARIGAMIGAYGASWSVDDVIAAAAASVADLAVFTRDRAALTGRTDLIGHAEMYERDVERMLHAGRLTISR